MSQKLSVCVAKGDGIGPEIMDSVLQIFECAEVPLQYHFVEMGKAIYDKGFSSGMTEEAKENIEKYGLLFKGPMETPKGGGVKKYKCYCAKIMEYALQYQNFQNHSWG